MNEPAHPLERTRYLMADHDGSFKLLKLTDTGSCITVQTAKREAEGSAPRVFAVYSGNGLPGGLNMAIVTALLCLRYAPQIEQRIAARKFNREVSERVRDVLDKSETLTATRPQPLKGIGKS